MFALTYIPSYTDVRALLGVSSEELEDDDIGVRLFVRVLEQDLQNVDASLLADYTAISAVAFTMRTTTQKRLFEAVQTYSTFHIAEQLCVALPQFSPKTIGDGKAIMQRHADSPYKVTIEGVTRGKNLALANLRESLATFRDTAYESPTPFVGMRVSVPTSDPVTGT